MPEYKHGASVVVNARPHEVFAMWSHFNDFPKFMSFVREVTYYDDKRSHWVVDVVGRHEWDAVNENWVEGRQIGWRSTDGMENHGVIRFEPVGEGQSQINVEISYNPPAGFLGDIGEHLGAGKRFEQKLKTDLENFARLVAGAAPGALDPHSSSYLFHESSAAAQGTTTNAQDATMDDADVETIADNSPALSNSR